MTIEEQLDAEVASLDMSPIEAHAFLQKATQPTFGVKTIEGQLAAARAERVKRGLPLKDCPKAGRFSGHRAKLADMQSRYNPGSPKLAAAPPALLTAVKAPAPTPPTAPAAHLPVVAPAPASVTPAATADEWTHRPITVGELTQLAAARAADPEVGKLIAHLGITDSQAVGIARKWNMTNPLGYRHALETEKSLRAHFDAKHAAAQPVTAAKPAPVAPVAKNWLATPTSKEEFLEAMRNIESPAARGAYYQEHALKFFNRL